MQNKGVDRLEFWKERIDTAQKDHYSVYVTGHDDWNRINEAHRDIFDKEIQPNESVLDAGCGYGRWAQRFNNYMGVDFSPDFIAKARKENHDKLFMVANLKELPFSDKTFDVAFCVSIKKMIIDNLGEDEWFHMEQELKRVAKKVLLLEYEDPAPYTIL
jgi:ubiquinone/menaquinone biosynthesis C-methylase UbiE